MQSEHKLLNNNIRTCLPLGQSLEQFSILHQELPQGIVAVRLSLIQIELTGLIQFWHLWLHTPSEQPVKK